MPNFTTRPEIAQDIEVLTKMLVGLPVGATIPNEDLSAAIGRDVTASAGRYPLLKAREAAEAICGSLFEAVRGVGIKRLPASHAHSVGKAALGKIRRAARRGADRLDGLRGNLDEPEQRRVIAMSSQLRAIAHVASSQASVRIEAAMPDAAATVDAGRIFDIVARRAG